MKLYPRDPFLRKLFDYSLDSSDEESVYYTKEEKEEKRNRSKERDQKIKDFWMSICEQVNKDDGAAEKLGEVLAIIDSDEKSALECLSHYIDYAETARRWYENKLNETFGTGVFSPFRIRERDAAVIALRKLIDFFKAMGIYDDKGELLIDETEKKFHIENLREEEKLEKKIKDLEKIIKKLSK